MARSILTSLMLMTTFALLGGCATATAPEPVEEKTPTTSTPAKARARSGPPAQIPMPQTFRLVGVESVGAPIAAKLEAEGIDVAASFEGRQAGIRTFCSGNAEGLALAEDLLGDDRRACRDLGAPWSVVNDDEGRIVYVRYEIVEDLRAQSETF